MNVKFGVAGFISASGSTAAAVTKACQDGELDAEMRVIIANTESAGEKIRQLQNPPPIIVIPRRNYSSAEDFGGAILFALEENRIDFAGLWGWDPIMPDNVIERYARRMTNQHPDLVPYFGGPGMNGIVPVCARFNLSRLVHRLMKVQPVSHWVTNEVDGGAVVMKGEVWIEGGDTCETLYDRVKLEEHRVQIATVKAAIQGTLCEIPIRDPCHRGEESLLARAKAAAIAHHSGQTQSALKVTKT